MIKRNNDSCVKKKIADISFNYSLFTTQLGNIQMYPQ